MNVKSHNTLWYANCAALWLNSKLYLCLAMVLTDRALYSDVNSKRVSICSGLAAIFNGKFQAISGHFKNGEREPSLGLLLG